jgi:thiol-disulfide isomerase/thioredoxin
VLLSVSACNQPPSVYETPILQTGYWQATITLPGGDIETGIEISRAGEVYQTSLVNGQERVRINDVSFLDGELLLRFPAFNNEIRATLIDGKLVGELTIVGRFGKTQVMPFSAMPGNQRNREGSDAPMHDMSGRWQVRFHEPDGTDSPSVGEFAQRGSRLFGTFLTPNGDFRFLAGHVLGNGFKLSTFDGAHAFLFSGEIGDTGDIQNASFWSATSWHQNWSATRNEDIKLPDAFQRTFLKPGYDTFEFEFPDPAGVVVSLADDKFAGKVVLITIAGTWCPNCNDEAAFMAPLHKEYRDQGLEVVALMFEHFEEQDIAAEQVLRFREKFDIEYDTLIAGISDKTAASEVLPALSAVLAYPTTIFTDRGGRVRQIHTGFSGPGTGEHYEQLQQEFRSLITTLLAEPEDLIETLTSDQVPEE